MRSDATSARLSAFGYTIDMARLEDLVVDCEHPAALARFWADALDQYEVAPYDEDELARLGSLGIDDPADDPTVVLLSQTGGPRIWFQRVPEAKLTKNRVHMDLSCDDQESECERLVDLGARQAADQPTEELIVMYDSEGNEFCLVKRQKAQRGGGNARPRGDVS